MEKGWKKDGKRIEQGLNKNGSNENKGTRTDQGPINGG